MSKKQSNPPPPESGRPPAPLGPPEMIQIKLKRRTDKDRADYLQEKHTELMMENFELEHEVRRLRKFNKKLLDVLAVVQWGVEEHRYHCLFCQHPGGQQHDGWVSLPRRHFEDCKGVAVMLPFFWDFYLRVWGM